MAVKKFKVAGVSDIFVNESEGSSTPVTISQVSPPLGAVGDLITVDGSGFSSLTEGQVFVGGVSALFTATDDTHLVFTVPSGAQSGAIQIGNAVTDPIFNVYNPTQLSLDFRPSTLDPRIAVSGTGVMSIRTPVEQAMLIQQSGAPWFYPQSIDWTVRYIWDPLAADGYLFCAIIDGQEWSMRTAQNGIQVILKVRDVDDVTPGIIVGNGNGSGGVAAGDEVLARWVYNSEGSATNRLTFSINGVTSLLTNRGGPSGPPISTVTEAYIGSNNGVSPYGGKITFFGAAGGIDAQWFPEFVAVGDSTMAGASTNADYTMAGIYTATECWTRAGIYSLAGPGENIADQQTLWDQRASLYNEANVTAVVVLIGINNLGADGQSAAQTITALQAFVNHMKATGPVGMKIVLLQILPTLTVDQTQLGLVNQAIIGLGPTPITNVDARVSGAHDALDNGMGAIKEWLSMGDELHPNTGGRRTMDPSIRRGLVMLNLLP